MPDPKTPELSTALMVPQPAPSSPIPTNLEPAPPFAYQASPFAPFLVTALEFVKRGESSSGTSTDAAAMALLAQELEAIAFLSAATAAGFGVPLQPKDVRLAFEALARRGTPSEDAAVTLRRRLLGFLAAGTTLQLPPRSDENVPAAVGRYIAALVPALAALRVPGAPLSIQTQTTKTTLARDLRDLLAEIS